MVVILLDVNQLNHKNRGSLIYIIFINEKNFFYVYYKWNYLGQKPENMREKPLQQASGLVLWLTLRIIALRAKQRTINFFIVSVQ